MTGLRWPYRGGALALLGLLAGCTRISDQDRFEGPEQTLEIVDTTPRPGELGVDPAVRIDLCMSGRVDPRSVSEFDAALSSGPINNDIDLAVQLVPWLEPGVDAPPTDTTAPWCEGSVLSVRPRSPLTAGAQYRLILRPSPVGWSGESLSTDGPLWVELDEGAGPRFILEFTIDPEPFVEPPTPGKEPPPPEPLTLTDLFSPGGPFDPQRELCSCHQGGDELAMARLDLSDPSVAFEALVGDTSLRETGFPMVSPRRASESFLVQKLVRDRHGDALPGLLGDTMPPAGAVGYIELLRVVEWIEGGAGR